MRELVVGDIVQLYAGDMIPADMRLIESRDLFISQAVLTGEALPVEKYDTLGDVAQKSASAVAADEENLLDMPNICFMGTNVVSGTAQAVVVATGPRTYFGSLAKAIVGTRVQTAFDRGVNSVSWLLIRFMLVMVPVVFLINGIMKGEWWDALLFARGGGRRPDPGNAADDRQRQSGERCHGDGEAQSGGQTPQRDPEPRRHGRVVYRQNRHADAGQNHS